MFDIDLLYIDGSGQPPVPELSARYADRLKGPRSKTRIPFSQFDYFVFSRALYSAAVSRMTLRKYDYVLCDYGISALYGLLLKERFNVPYIYCSHNLEYKGCLDKARADWRRFILAPYVYAIERIGVRQCSVLVPITSEDADIFGSWTDSSKIVTIPQGFDETVYNTSYEAPRNDPRIVLFCGNYNIQFNRDVVRVASEQIVPRVLATRPRTQFVFAGLGPPTNISHPAIHFPGFVDDYPALLKSADVFISPMLQGRGFPTKIVEALACGKPTIATETGARAVEGTYESLIVCALDEFPDRICRVLDAGQPVRRNDAQQLKERYSWPGNIQRLANRLLPAEVHAE
jgi:glycosyltransferase involved in cell wall biosynthesis